MLICAEYLHIVLSYSLKLPGALTNAQRKITPHLDWELQTSITDDCFKFITNEKCGRSFFIIQ